MRDNLTGRSYIVQAWINLIPKKIRLKLNPDRYAIEKFVASISKALKPGSKVLDAGAGPCPYKKSFKHCDYESTDVDNSFNCVDFTCLLDKIPRKSSSYDAILSTEVLEHVENPQKVVNEFFRVLKKGGHVFLTVPQGRQIHQEPYNFFYFTKYGLSVLFRNAGFKRIKIWPKGGYFWFLADAIRFNGILQQYKNNWIIYYPLRMIEYPLTNLLIPFLLFHLDFLDREKKWTCGYLVNAEK